jgi:hypothetical protein
MYRVAPGAIALTVLALNTAASIAAGPADVFKDAYAKAEAANGRAGKLKNQWTPTQSALGAARKAADSGDYDAAVRLAKQAEDLANASIAQSEREDKLWTDAEIR